MILLILRILAVLILLLHRKKLTLKLLNGITLRKHIARPFYVLNIITQKPQSLQCSLHIQFPIIQIASWHKEMPFLRKYVNITELNISTFVTVEFLFQIFRTESIRTQREWTTSQKRCLKNFLSRKLSREKISFIR